MPDKCTYTRTDLVAYYQNQLSKEEEIKVQEHLIGCEQCRQILQEIRNLEVFLFEGEVEKEENSEKDVKQSLFRRYRYIWIASAAVAAVSLLFLLNPFGREEGHPVKQKTDDVYLSNDTLKIDSISKK